MLIRVVYFLILFADFVVSKEVKRETQVAERFKVENEFNIDSEHESVTDAVKDVIKSFFVPRTSILDIITSSTNEESRVVMDDIITETLAEIDSRVSVSLDDVETVFKSERTKVFNIFYVDSYAAFKRIFARLLPEEFNFRGYYLIVITEKCSSQQEEIKQMMTDLWSLYIVNVNVIHVTNLINSVSRMMTFYPYTSSHCEKVFPVVHNSYVVNHGFVRDIQHFPNKLKNLHGCPLSVATFNSPPFVIVTFNENNASNHVKGFDGVLIKVLAARMNFTLEHVIMKNTLWGYVDHAGNNTGAIAKVMERKGRIDKLNLSSYLSYLVFS